MFLWGVVGGKKTCHFSYNKSSISQQKLARGLDEVYPFSETLRVEIVLREAEHILSDNVNAVTRNNASRIWGFMSKFAMLDRFSKTLDVDEQCRGVGFSRKMCSPDYLGTGSKVRVYL